MKLNTIINGDIIKCLQKCPNNFADVFIFQGKIIDNPKRVLELETFLNPIKEKYVMLKDNIQIIDLFENVIRKYID